MVLHWVVRTVRPLLRHGCRRCWNRLCCQYNLAVRALTHLSLFFLVLFFSLCLLLLFLPLPLLQAVIVLPIVNPTWRTGSFPAHVCLCRLRTLPGGRIRFLAHVCLCRLHNAAMASARTQTKQLFACYVFLVLLMLARRLSVALRRVIFQRGDIVL